METEDIEKLKDDRDQLLSMIDRLNRLTADTEATNWPEVHRIFVEAESLKPKPVIFEAWGNFYDGWVPCLYTTPERAKSNAGNGAKRVAVHLREVTPAPEWERWRYVESGIHHGDGSRLAWASTAGNARVIAERHNAEMKRVTGTEGK